MRRGRRLHPLKRYAVTEPDEFVTLAGAGVAESRIKASTFHAVALPATDEQEARRHLAARERLMFDASHHCSAWRFRGGGFRANDAGEPSGSAGAPILAAIDGAGVTDCVVIVTRYYGGTKLGVGGLVRAYGDAAAEAIAAAPRRFASMAARLEISYPYASTAAVMRALDRFGAVEMEHGYDPSGAGGELQASVPRHALDLLEEELREATAGLVHPVVSGTRILYRNEDG